jgi:TRAP transporter TAXI family solute receptor
LITLAGIFLLSVFAVSQGSTAEIRRFVMPGGPLGSNWAVGVGAGMQLLNEQLKDKYFFTVTTTGGSVENVRRMMAGEYKMGWVHLATLYDAWNGVGLFEGQKPYKDLRLLVHMADQTIMVATLAKSPLKSPIGPAGSGGAHISKAIFTALGITEKVNILYSGFDVGAQSLKDGQIDAAMTSGGPYVSPAIMEISRSVTVRLVEPTADETAKIETAFPYLFEGVIPPNTTPGENADRGRKALFFGVLWAALTSMPEDVVYDLLKVTQKPGNRELLGKVSNYWTSAGPYFDVAARVGVPLHPGAVKFWREQGTKLPPALVK